MTGPERDLEADTDASPLSSLGVEELTRLVHQARERERLSAALGDIDAHLHSKFDTEVILQSALDLFVETLGADAGDIKVRDKGGWVVRFQNGFTPNEKGLRLPQEEAPVAVRVYSSGRPVIVEDYTKQPELWPGFPRDRGLTATLAVPLIVRDEIVGALFAQMTSGPRQFSAAEVDFAERMAASVSLALDNAQRLISERAKLDQVTAINEVSNLAVSALEPREAAKRALDYVVAHLGISAAAAWQIVGDGTMNLIASANFPPAYVALVESIPLDADLDNAEVARTAEPIVAENLSDRNPAAQQRFATAGAQVGAYAIVPILSKNGVIGVLGFTWPEPRPIPDGDVAFYETLARQIGLALENARLFEAEKRELARTQLLKDLTMSVATETSLDAVAEAAISALRRHLGIKTGDVRSLDEASQELSMLAVYGISEDLARDMKRVPVASPGYLASKAIRSKLPATQEDEVLTPERIALIERAGVANDRYIQVPLIHQGKVVGVFGMSFAGRRSFTQDEIQLYLVVAGILAQAIQRARALEAEHLHANRMEVLHDVSALVTSSLDLGQVTAIALESAVEHIGVRAASAWLVDRSSGRLTLVGSDGFPPRFVEDFSAGLGLDADYDVCRAVRTGAPVVHADARGADVPSAVAAAYGRYDIPLGALIVLPLQVGTNVVGALTLAWDAPRRFDADSLEFDVSLANVFSTALENARLFQDVREQGERISEIINTMSDAFVTVDREWRFVLLNPQAEAILGRTADDLVGKRMDEEFPDFVGWPQYRRAMEERVPVRFESYAEMSGVFVEVHAYPSLDGISMYVSDITKRKSDEADLERVSALLDAHISNSPLAVVEFDSAFNLIRWSDGAERIFGWSADEALGKSMSELKWVHEEDAEIVARESAGLFTGKTPRSFNTNRNYRKDGSVIWCEWYSSAMYDDDGVLVSIFSQVLDVTSRRAAEEAVRSALAEVADERTRLRQIIDEIPVGVLLIGPDGALLEVNEAANRIWAGALPKAANTAAYGMYEGYRHGADQLLEPDDWPASKAIRSGRAESSLIDLLRADRATRVLRISALPIFDVAGKLTRVVTIIEDVTEQIDAQKLAVSLNEISAEVSATLDEREIVRRLTALGRDAFATQSAAAVVQRDGGWVLDYGVGIAERLIGRPLRDSDVEAIGTVFQQAAPVFSSDAENDTRVLASKLAELGAKSVIALPLISHGDHAGVLFFWHTGRRRDFSEAQVEFARKLMTTATLALDNAHLYEREHHIAETLQEAILTPPEPVEGLDIAYLYRPASEAANVGGDFYDVIPLQGGRVGFVVGDVSGKGIDAARFTTLMKDGARAFLLEGDSPVEALERLNRVAWHSTPVERFATAFLGILDVSSGALECAGAGHPSCFVMGPDGVRALTSSAGVLGAWDGLHFEARDTSLAPGEVLVLYTDGVTEARHEKEFFGEERLIEVLESLRQTAVAELPKALLQATLDFSTGALRDDIVILCLSPRPEPPKAPTH